MSLATLLGFGIHDVSDVGRGLQAAVTPDTKVDAKFGEAVEVIVLPPKNAMPSPQSKHDPTLRGQHIVVIQAHGRLGWQVSSGYNQRSRVEAQMGCWKGAIGSKLKACNLENQKTEVRIGVSVLNKMTELGRPEIEAAT